MSVTVANELAIRRSLDAGVERHFKTHVGHKGIKATRTKYNAWHAIVGRAQWRTPEDVKASYPKASILKGSRVVFNIKGNDYRLIASVQYQAGVLAIRFSAPMPSTTRSMRRACDGCDPHPD